MSKQLVFAAVGTFTMLFAGAAFAASSAGPEPYAAPNPVYTQHKIVSSVYMKAPAEHVSLTSSR